MRCRGRTRRSRGARPRRRSRPTKLEPERKPQLRPEPFLRILLVDDEPALRALLRTTLESLDVELDEAEDAASALFAIGTRRPDVVVLDVGLPGMSGLTFCRRLKEDPQTDDIPVVLLTGARLAQEAADAGAD